LTIYILDADVIIWCANNNKLDLLFKNKRIIIPNVIFEQAFKRTDKETGEIKSIELQKFIDNKSLEIVDNPASDDIEEIKNTYEQCPELAEIHDGEAECIFLITKNKDYKLCTGELGVMKVIGFRRLSTQMVSLEELIGSVKNLRYDFTKKCLKENLKIGSNLFVKYGNWS